MRKEVMGREDAGKRSEEEKKIKSRTRKMKKKEK